MSYDGKYAEVLELTDKPSAVNDLIDGGGWDLINTAIRKKEISDGIYTDQVIYVVGKRYDSR